MASLLLLVFKTFLKRLLVGSSIKSPMLSILAKGSYLRMIFAIEGTVRGAGYKNRRLAE
jgi:hypothetical protein